MDLTRVREREYIRGDMGIEMSPRKRKALAARLARQDAYWRSRNGPVIRTGGNPVDKSAPQERKLSPGMDSQHLEPVLETYFRSDRDETRQTLD